MRPPKVSESQELECRSTGGRGRFWVAMDCPRRSPARSTGQQINSVRKRSIFIQIGCALVPFSPVEGFSNHSPGTAGLLQLRGWGPAGRPFCQSASGFTRSTNWFPIRVQVKKEFHLKITQISLRELYPLWSR